MKLNSALLSGLRLPQKFLILGVIALILVAVPFYQFFQTAQDRVTLAEKELAGFQPTRSALNLIKLTQEHRGMTAGALGGNQKLVEELVPKKAAVVNAVAALDADVKTIADPRIQERWRNAAQEWGKLATDLANRSVDLPTSFARHTKLIGEYLVLLDGLVDHFGLSLDSKAENNFLIKAAYGSIAQLNESFGQLRATGTGHLAEAARLRATGKSVDESMPIAERIKVATLIASARGAMELSIDSLNKALQASPALQTKLQSQMASAEGAAKRAMELGRKEVAESQTLTMDSAEYFAAITKGMAEQFALSDMAVAALGEELQATAKSLRLSQITISAIILVLIALGIVLSLFIMRTITNPMNHLRGVMEKLRLGDAEVRARIDSHDEIGELARQFDQMVDEREAVSAQIKKENEQLNESVLTLLQGVAQLSRKDLTAKVPVAEDVTGAVADALNMLSSETAKVLQQVTNISADVTGASLKVKQQSDTVRETAEEERQLVIKTAEDLLLAAEGMSRIEQLAQSANIAADNAIKTTQAALATVSATVGGINSTRDTIRETEKRIKRLGERSQEISGVVGIINTIAERTHILALNASMHAASAGEAGRGFAVVAEEVQRLAESSRQATAQIATLVNNIQVETADTVNTMNSAITQVVDGSRLAEQAGEQMKLTQATTADLVASVREIASSSQEQAQISAGLLTRSGEIRKSSERTSQELTEQAGQTENLVEYARALLGSVRVFKLPAT
ncbi:MAG: methyl-accepting chemotaxis protein [Rhodocyclales bacterium]|nr:methyl-accepting chemotaxis protein [Rhodocyclales bacterium]